MERVILPSAYFPPLPWMRAAVQATHAVIDVHEHYIKQTCRNRCTIITANGLMHLVVPVENYRNHTPVADIRIDYATDWQRVHAHAIRSAYGKSPFFEYYGERILALYATRPALLTEWNERCLQTVLALLKLNVEFQTSTAYVEATAENDLRSAAFDVKPENTPAYTQVFMERHGFYSGLSVLDALFCCGREAVQLFRD